MKFKDLDTALKYFIPIVKEDFSPIEGFDWKNSTDKEVEDILKADKEFKKLNYVPYDSDDPLYYYTGYLVLEIGHSRRGQHYYILCNKENLELNVLATEPDGHGGMINLPDILFTMIQNGDIIII